MTGYQEIFTDPSYFGQIMVATNAPYRNYGIAMMRLIGQYSNCGLVCKIITLLTAVNNQ